MKNKFIIVSVTACAALCLTANAEKPKSSPSSKAEAGKPAKGNLSSKDKSFMNKAAKGGMMEVEWGKVASQNAQNADVKKFGNRMVTEHSKANNELMALAKEEGVQLPASKGAGKWKSDKEYMDMMVKDHEKDLAEFQEQAKNGTDPDLKKFAEKGSKMVQNHLGMARNIQAKLK